MAEARDPTNSARHRADAMAVLLRLRESGHEAYFAGGCVRDELLGLSPKDFDVATSAHPPRVRDLFKNTQAVGAAFGVILVRIGQSVIEVATFRSDGTYADGRRPDHVIFTTAQDDAQRRDFTINGLFLDPIDNRVIDFVGGQADLQAKIIRAIGNPSARFAEDHLRLLRAVRFASRLGFTIEPTTAAAIKNHAHELPRISPERIADELRRMLVPPTRNDAYRLLLQLGLLPTIMRFLPEKPTHRVDEAFSLLMALGAPLSDQSITFGLALAALTLDFRLHASGNHDLQAWLQPQPIRKSTAAMRQALRISNDEESAMEGALGFGHLLNPHPTIAQLKRFLAAPHSKDARHLMAAAARCGLCTQQINTVLSRLSELEKTDYAPAPLITGDDLTAAGAKPGPTFKKALDAVYDAQLEARITDKPAALQLALKLIDEQHKT